jgi:hypothetical protein
MTNQEQAFIRGIQKRAAECGLEKTAFVGNLIGGLIRGLVVPAAVHTGTHALLNKAILRPGIVGKGAKMLVGGLGHTNPFVNTISNMAFHMGLHQPTEMIADPIAKVFEDSPEDIQRRHNQQQQQYAQR